MKRLVEFDKCIQNLIKRYKKIHEKTLNDNNVPADVIFYKL